MSDPRVERLAHDVASALEARDATVAVAESLTGGLVLAALTAAPGASTTVRGGIVAYALDVKADQLGVDAALLERTQAVDPEVARQMAEGVRDRLGSTYGIATTGEAGPESASGQPVGTVHVAAAGPDGTKVRSRLLSGDRGEIQQGSVVAVLEVLAELLGV